MTLAQKLFGFHGRLRRRDFWPLVLASWLGVAVLTLGWFGAIAVVNDGDEVQSPLESWGFVFGLFLLLAVGLAATWSHAALVTKRLHDQGYSGWWQLIQFAPFGGVVLFFWCWMDGDARPNKHGPSPKVEHLADTFA